MGLPQKITPELAADLLVVRETFHVPLRRIAADIGVSTQTAWKWLRRAQRLRGARA